MKKKETQAGSPAQTVTPNKKKKLPGWVIIPVLAGIVVLGVGASMLMPKKESAGTKLKAIEIKKTSIKDVYNSTGTIESEQTKTYYSPVTAPISKLGAVLGAPVKSGDLLVSYDVEELEKANTQAQLTLQSSLAASRSTKTKNAQAVDAARAGSEKAAKEINRLADQVNALADQLDNARQKYETNLAASSELQKKNAQQQDQINGQIAKYEKLVTDMDQIIRSTEAGYAGGRTTLQELEAVPETERTPEQTTLLASLRKIFEKYDNAVRAKEEYSQKLSDLKEQLAGLSVPEVDDAGYAKLQEAYNTAYAQWEAAYTQADASGTADIGMTDEELNALSISDNLAELAALSPKELLEKGKEGIQSDMNGVIASLEVADGSIAAQGAPLFTIASTDQIRVRIELSPDDFDKVKTGTAAEIKTGENTYKAVLTQVDRIATKNAKGNPVIRASLHISDPDDKITIGANAKITMILAQSDNVLAVPNEAINTSTDGDFVYVIKDGVVEKRTIKTGVSSATETEIIDGLSEGDLVVNDLSTDITPGMTATADVAD